MRRATGLVLAALLVAAAMPALPPATAQGTTGSQVVVLVHHPLDHVDPFGVPFGGADTFASRYQAFSAGGTFAFPTFVADGVLPVSSLPDPNVPYAATLANYTALVDRRLALESPVTLRVQGALGGDDVRVQAEADPVAPLSDLQHPGALHLWVAVAEDFIHFQPDARVSNGVTEHRFTVRALSDLGGVDLANGTPALRAASVPLGGGWQPDHLVAAAWLAADGPFQRFAAGEVLQAAWAHVGAPAVTQATKGVLVELYSATWCAPCLYGDLAVEQLAVQRGGAPTAVTGPTSWRYLVAPDHPGLAVTAAVLAVAAIVVPTVLRRRRDR